MGILHLKKSIGALTLKQFPFELRNWGTPSFESVDPTDSFGQSTMVYVEESKVIKIEPSYDDSINGPWLTDKGRCFFDSVYPFKKWAFLEEPGNFKDEFQDIYMNWEDRKSVV